MATQYEIFLTEPAGEAKSTKINALTQGTFVGYPNAATDTECYRFLLKKYNANEWAGGVDQRLINACASMSPAERLLYYDGSDLKSEQWLIDNNWYAPY